jgi:hypothetical protein
MADALHGGFVRPVRVCVALATCGAAASLGVLSATAAGCDVGSKFGALDGAGLFGDACWIFCDGGLSFGSGGCPHGTASCGGDASACETPTLDSNSNCGGCGVRCPAGHSCMNGSCFAVEDLAQWDNAVPQPTQGLAVGGGVAYLAFIGGGGPSGLVSVRVSGGSPRTLRADNVFAVFADDQGAYFVDGTDSGSFPLVTMAPTDRAPRTLLPDASAIAAVVGTTAQSVFYGLVQNPNPNPAISIAEVPKDGGTQVVLATDESPPAHGAPFAAVGGSGIYWIDQGNVFAQALGSGATSQLSSDGDAVGIAASANAVYVLTSSGAARYDVTMGKWNNILTKPVTAASIAADDTALYVVAGSLYSDSQIVRVGADGTSTVLAGAQASALSIAIDDTYAYWWAFDFGDAGAPQVLVLRRVAKAPQ